MRIKIAQTLCITLLACALSRAQEVAEIDKGLRMLAETNGEVIKLRWAPTDWPTWKLIIREGVSLERFTIRRQGQLLPLEERSVGTPLGTAIKPWEDQERWKALMAQDDYASIGAQAIYGSTFQVVSDQQSEEVSLIDVARDQQNRFSFGLFAADHSFEAAMAMGLAWTDSTARSEETYVYRVFPAVSSRMQLDTGYASLALEDIVALPKILDFSAAFEDGQVLLAWNKALYANTYVSYTVERSEDGENYFPVHDKPLINPENTEEDTRYMMYIDSLPANGVEYHYRVHGNTAFNLQGPPSDPMIGKGIEALPFSFPVIESVLPYENDKQFGISWRYNEEDEVLILGFRVYRAGRVDGPYTLLNPDELMAPNLRFFVDQSPMPTNYYKVVGIDEYDREVESFPALAQLVDATPPAAPMNVRGKIMDDGTMIMTWDENSEEDMLGYRVWMSNDSTDEFTQLTNKVHPRNVYLDSTNLNTLSHEVYIKVAAYDYRQNMSPMSKMAILMRPDTIPPSEPSIRSIDYENAMVRIRWAGSTSDDLARHELWHRPDTGSWQMLTELDITEDTLHISEYAAGLGNYYQIRAVDKTGLSSQSQEVSILIESDEEVPSPWNLNAAADRRAKQVSLQWEYDPNAQVHHFVILRGEGNNDISTVELVSPQDIKIDHRRKAIYRYVDDQPQMNTAYRYAVRAVLTDERQSPISTTTQIAY
jgi:fibronectin type 3 domain-containing protein